MSTQLVVTSLYDIEYPGNFADSTTVTPSGLGGNEAPDVSSASEHTAHEYSVSIRKIVRKVEADEVT
jgi:hypothetical protein